MEFGRGLGAAQQCYDGEQVNRGSDTIQVCVDRVLQSGTFRNAPSSRRLLKYLTDHFLAGDSEQLKEYTIGVDAFGKPADYDPRLDSTVRIQIGRLRQKLAEYYREEGKGEAFLVDLPKGRFSLTCEARPVLEAAVESVVPAEEEVAEVEPAVTGGGRGNPWRVAALALGGICLALVAVLIISSARPRTAVSGADFASPDLAELWRPFLNPGRALLVAVGNPLFLQFENKALYRDLSVEKPEDLLKSPQFGAVSKALGSQESRAVHYYAAVGDVSAAFVLGQRLGPYQARMSVVRSSQLQWQQLADANVLFLGPPRFFGDKLASLPVALEITEGTDGFQVVHPRAGEAAFYKFRDPTGFFAEDGEACVLITHAPGPVGNTDVMTFASNSTFGRMGAIDGFTDAAFAKMLVGKMRGASGHIAQYFQVLLKVKYKGGVPTESSYLLHRELRRRN